MHGDEIWVQPHTKVKGLVMAYQVVWSTAG